MEQNGRKFSNDESASEAFYLTCFEDICSRFEPKPGTLESMIMIMGAEFLYPAMAETARVMVLDHNIVQVEDGVVLLPGNKLVFDFQGYYFDVIEGDLPEPCLKDDEYYEKQLEWAEYSDSDF